MGVCSIRLTRVFWLSVPFLFVPTVGAVEFNWGAIEGNLNSTVSYGAALRVQDRDERLIGKANLDPSVALLTADALLAAPGALSVNSDAGNLNYDQHDLISHALKLNQDLELRIGNYGLFVRGFYFHDFANASKSELSPAARARVGRDGDVLDAFLWGDWEVRDRPISARIGKQVVNWGESTFIQGGINAINPVDLSRLRVAGAELKEALLPVSAIWGSAGISDSVSVELFIQFEWKPLLIDPPGTYFSTANFLGSGADGVMLGSGQFTRAQAPQLYAPRAPDVIPDDGGEYGMALRWLPSWADVEFGFYFLRYHSRLPMLGVIAVTTPEPNSGAYFAEYPEGIKLYGISFNTTLGATAVQGEYSYRPNLPLQIDDAELLFHGLSPLNAVSPNSHFLSQLGTAEPGVVVPGYVRHRVDQGQMSFTRLLGPTRLIESDSLLLLGEVGFTRVLDLPSRATLRYEGPGTYTGGGADRTSGHLRNIVTQTSGFADAFSWGYRLVVRPEYYNLVGGWNAAPYVAFSHDVNGTAPTPGGNFIEGRKTWTVGVGVTSLNRFAVNFGYTIYTGAGLHNQIRDRDFAALDFKYSF